MYTIYGTRDIIFWNPCAQHKYAWEDSKLTVASVWTYDGYQFDHEPVNFLTKAIVRLVVISIIGIQYLLSQMDTHKMKHKQFFCRMSKD